MFTHIEKEDWEICHQLVRCDMLLQLSVIEALTVNLTSLLLTFKMGWLSIHIKSHVLKIQQPNVLNVVHVCRIVCL